MFTLHFSRIEGAFALHKLTEGEAPLLIATGPSHIGPDPEAADLAITSSNDHRRPKPQLSLV